MNNKRRNFRTRQHKTASGDVIYQLAPTEAITSTVMVILILIEMDR